MSGLGYSSGGYTYLPAPSTVNYANCSTNLQRAELAYSLAFNRFPYTNLLMIEDLLQTSGATYQDWFSYPNTLNNAYAGNDVTLRWATKSESYTPPRRADGSFRYLP